MAGYEDVTVWAGADYRRVPISGNNLLRTDALTSPAAWTSPSSVGFDPTQPATVAEARGMRLSWTTDPGYNGIRAVYETGLVPGHTYSYIVTVEPSVVSTQYRATAFRQFAVGPWVGGTQTLVVVFDAVDGVTEGYFGIETAGPHTDTHLVTQIGLWDHGDLANRWHLLEVEPCNVALPLSITHGRSSIGNQPDSPSCEFTWLGETAPAAVGDGVRVALTTLADSGTGTVDRVRFDGVIAGLKAHESQGLVRSWEVSAIGHQARLGYQPVAITRLEESDVARVQAIAAAAQVAVTVKGTAGVVLAADSIDSNALDAFQEVCASSGGLFWQAPDGRLTYGTANHRGVTSADVVGMLPCEAIGDGLDWEEAMESVVNSVKISWGPAEGGTRSEVTYTDPISIGKPWGLRHVDISTTCASDVYAEEFGQLVLARRRFPYWSTPDALVHADLLIDVEARLVATLDVGMAVLVPFLAEPGVVPSVLTAVVIEGFAESWTEAGHFVQFAVSDQRRWARTTLRTWGQAKTETWAHWKAGSWLNALVVENE